MDEKNEKFRFGFVYPLVSAVVDALAYVNLVELFKAIGMKLARSEADRRRYASVAIDLYVVFKWGVLICLWWARVNHPLATIAVAYLIAMNVFVYLYYHVWRPPYDPSRENRRRRFVNLLLSIVYNAACYAYLYNLPFAHDFTVTGPFDAFTASAFLATARSMLVGFPNMAPATAIGQALVLSQTFVVFLFITIVLSASIPQPDPDNKPD
jgi:hypothetical protein